MRESDINVLCRLCLNKSFFYSNIYISQALEGIPFYEDINYVYDLKISTEDGSPEYVCQKCFEDVTDFKLCKINAHSIKSQLFQLKSKLNTEGEHEYRGSGVQETESIAQSTTATEEKETEEIEQEAGKEDTESVNEIFIKEEPIEMIVSPLEDKRLSEDDVQLTDSQDAVEEEVKPEIVFHDIPLVMPNEVMQDEVAEDRINPHKSSTRGLRKRRKRVCQMSGCCSFEGTESTLNSAPGKPSPCAEESTNGDTQAVREPFILEEVMYVCSMCSMAFPNKAELTQHLFTHSEGEFSCVDCSIAFPNKLALAQHLSMHFACGECSIAFPSKLALTQHLAMHSPGPLVCAECSVVFPNKLALVQHNCTNCKRVFSCEQCSMSFPNKVSFSLHFCRKRMVAQESEILHWKLLKTYPTERTVGVGGEYRCGFCSRRFLEHTTLLRHEMAHYEGRDFTCEVCGKQFLRLKNLRRHEMVHKVDRPHQCNDCDKRFQDLSSLRRHEKIHKGVRPFHCVLCTKEFFRNDHLLSHMRVHLNERPFQCERCGKGFTERSTLKRHQKLHHPEQFIPNGHMVPNLSVMQDAVKSEACSSLGSLS